MRNKKHYKIERLSKKHWILKSHNVNYSIKKSEEDK